MDWSKLSRQVTALVLVFALALTLTPLGTQSAAASPSGEYVYASDGSGGVVAYDATDGSTVWTASVSSGSIKHLRIGPEEEYLYITDTDGVGRKLDAADGSTVWSYSTGTGYTLYTGGADPSSSTVYFGDNDGRVIAVDDADGSVQWTKSIDSTAVYKIAIGPDGDTVYAGGYDEEVDAVDVSTQSIQWSFSATNRVQQLSVSHSGETVYTASSSDLWSLDAGSGSQQWRVTTSTAVNSIQAGPDGEYVYTTINDDVQRRDVSDGSTLWSVSPTTDGFKAVSVNPSGSQVYVVDGGGGARALDSSDGSQIWADSTGNLREAIDGGGAAAVDTTSVISGTVTDTAGDPIGNATVAIGSGSTDYATTNAKGEYSITVDGGSYEKVAAAKSGFAMNSTTVDLDGDKTVNLSLSTQSDPATGTVQTGFQNAAPGAKVDVLDPVTGEIVYTTLSDANGEYSINQTGEYTVRANRADTKEDTVRTTVEAGGYIPTLYIGSASGATDITTRDTTDPITGGDLDTLNLTSISECNALIESRYGEAATYLALGGFPAFGGVPAAADALGIFEFGPDSCEVDTAKQERLALLAGSAVTNQSEQNTQTVAENYLTDARQIAYAEGKIAAVEALKDGAVAEQAKFEANQSVDQYYQSIYVNTGSGYSTGVQQAKYVYEREYAQTDATGSWVYPVAADGSKLQFAANPWEEATVELPNGNTTIWAYRLSSGELVTPFPNKTSAPGGGPYITGPSLRVVGPDDTSDTRSGGAYTSIADSQTFGNIVSEVDSQRTQVKDNLAVTIDGTLAEIDPANITTTDFLSPSEIASRASTDYESTGYYGFAAAQLAATGYQGNLNTSHTIERASGEQVEGTLFYTGNDLDQFQNGSRYDPTAYNGTFLFATNGDGIQELTAPFEIVQQTDTQTGDPVGNATLQSYVYNTTTTDGLNEDLSLLSQVAEEYDEASTASGGFGLPEGTNTRVIVGLLILAGLLLATRD